MTTLLPDVPSVDADTISLDRMAKAMMTEFGPNASGALIVLLNAAAFEGCVAMTRDSVTQDQLSRIVTRIAGVRRDNLVIDVSTNLLSLIQLRRCAMDALCDRFGYADEDRSPTIIKGATKNLWPEVTSHVIQVPFSARHSGEKSTLKKMPLSNWEHHRTELELCIETLRPIRSCSCVWPDGLPDWVNVSDHRLLSIPEQTVLRLAQVVQHLVFIDDASQPKGVFQEVVAFVRDLMQQAKAFMVASSLTDAASMVLKSVQHCLSVSKTNGAESHRSCKGRCRESACFTIEYLQNNTSLGDKSPATINEHLRSLTTHGYIEAVGKCGQAAVYRLSVRGQRPPREDWLADIQERFSLPPARTDSSLSSLVANLSQTIAAQRSTLGANPNA